MKTTVLAVALLAAAVPALAQQAAAPSVPAISCGTPPDLPSSRMMEERTIKSRFERELKMYGDCVKNYVSDRQKSANEMSAAAKAHMDAGNKAVQDYNALMKQLNEAAK